MRLALGLKKTTRASERDRPDVAEARRLWRATTSGLPVEKLIFLDETGLSTKMARLYARSIGGARAVDSIPHGHWHTTTFVAGLKHQALVAPAVFDGPMDGESFLAYVEQILSPVLKPGDVVIMDNLSSHKVAGVRDSIQNTGASLRYLPPYSPDLNPIEQLFAKFKALLRKAAPRTLQRLWDRVRLLLSCFSPDECMNYFANSGYANATNL